MFGNNQTEVLAAFEMLLEEIEEEIAIIEEAGAQAFKARNHARAGEAAEQAQRITAFRDKVAALRKEWEKEWAARTPAPRPTTPERLYPPQPAKRRRAPRGARTPQTAFYQPILTALN